ncbi:MAG: N-acetyl-gamma-glutamyl-phosphate reductase [Candidatus Omnitrophica bacterium]|nr:N-acetyl-gamma-glutamyl-phosphate reductase [Candidatus Omnitrophota bacterium]
MVRVGIVGVTGYSGRELLRYLLRHPHVTLTYLAARRLSKPTPIRDIYPELAGRLNLDYRPFAVKEAAASADLLFLALPPGVAMTVVPALLNAGTFVIDLSGDYRLMSTRTFARAYGFRHRHPQALNDALYGLPELYREHLSHTRLVANPGCYPTAAILAAAPLVAKRLIAPDGIIIDAKSGVSGAGKSLKEELLFTEANEDLRAYKANDHQHMPEINQELGRLGRSRFQVVFVPHLAPMTRGLFATVYLRLKRRATASQVQRWYNTFYRDEPFVHVLPPPALPKTARVAHTNDCELAVRVVPGGRTVIALAAIDNLGKGAAGQAIQNMNVLLGFEETAGLQ